MHRRLFLNHIAFGLSTAFLGVKRGETLKPDNRPNIIFLLSDDQSTYTMGCYGNKDVQTPNLDKLAQDGMVFDNHYDTTAICMASRASIFTGLFEYRHGCNFGYGSINQNDFNNSYTSQLGKSGYITAFAGKFGVKLEGLKDSEQFDHWGGGPGQTKYDTAKNESMKKYADKYPHSTLSYGAFSCDVIKDAVKKQKPFCLSVSFKASHKPSTPDPQFDHIYKDKKFTKPENFGREHGTHLAKQSTTGRQYGRFESWGYKDNYDEEMALYHQLVYGIDAALGMIRAELEKQGIADNTIIIYTSDNGYLCGSHGYGSKVLPYEESTRAPLIVYDPRRKKTMGKNYRIDSLTGNVDFSPTIMELAGVPVPDNLDGKSLIPILDNPKNEIHDALPIMNDYGPGSSHYLGIVTKNWKYDYWWYEDENMKPAEELFDTQKDPSELKNLAANPEFSKTLQKMQALYDRQLEHWKKTAKGKHEKYGIIFDRTADSEKRKQAMGTSKKGKRKKKKDKKDKNKKNKKK